MLGLFVVSFFFSSGTIRPIVPFRTWLRALWIDSSSEVESVMADHEMITMRRWQVQREAQGGMRYRKQYSNGFSVQSMEVESIANHKVIMLEVGSFNVRASSRIDRKHRGSCKQDLKRFLSLRFPSQCIMVVVRS